jgi:hypothetical protein
VFYNSAGQIASAQCGKNADFAPLGESPVRATIRHAGLTIRSLRSTKEDKGTSDENNAECRMQNAE